MTTNRTGGPSRSRRGIPPTTRRALAAAVRGAPRPGRATYFHQSAGAVVMIAGRCLVLRRVDRDEWVFPKGHLEEGERPEDAALREVREETGLDVQIVTRIGATRFTFGANGSHRKRVEWFLARSVGGEIELERIFRESALVDAAGAQAILTHLADREIAARAFAVSSAGR